MNPLQPVEQAFGQHIGLNADWSSCAWHITGNFYLVDDEVDGVCIVVRDMKNENWEGSDFTWSFPYTRIEDAVSFCTALKGFLSLAKETFNPEIDTYP